MLKILLVLLFSVGHQVHTIHAKEHLTSKVIGCHLCETTEALQTTHHQSNFVLAESVAVTTKKIEQQTEKTSQQFYVETKPLQLLKITYSSQITYAILSPLQRYFPTAPPSTL